jgi:hypothetical protein
MGHLNLIIKLFNSTLILFAVYMAINQGLAMVTGKPDMLQIFGKWNFSRTGVQVIGAVTMVSALLLLFPKTFFWGNFLMAAGILLIICLHLSERNLRGVGIELPFFLMNLVILYLQHPLAG